MLNIAFSCPHIPAWALQTAREHITDICPPHRSANKTIRRSGVLVNEGLFGFVQMLLQISHEGGAAGADGGGIAGEGLVLSMNVTVGISDVDLAELRE